MPREDKEKVLWVELEMLVEPDADDVLWKLQRYMHAPLTWRLYSNCRVHHVSSTRRHDIFMLTEKDYPLSNAVMILMLSGKLQVTEDNEMARDLVMKIFMEANKPKSRSIQEAEIFSEMLKRELHALELANVHVLQGLESTTICTKVMDEWLALFNVKLRHIREDIEVRGQLKKPNHDDLHNKCGIYAPLLKHMKFLDKSSPTPLRKSYCSFINQILRRETREFANELQVGTKLPKVQSVWFEGSSGPNTIADTSMIFEAYSKMLEVFVPLLVDESSFLSFFMRFEGSSPNLTRDGDEDEDDDDANDEDLDMDIDENDANKFSKLSYKLRMIKCTAELFVYEARHQIEKFDKGVKQTGVMSFVPRYALLATQMEHYIQGQNRDLVDQAYIKIIDIMFVILEKISQADPKHSDTMLHLKTGFLMLLEFLLLMVEVKRVTTTEELQRNYSKCLRLLVQELRLSFEVTAAKIPFQVGLSKSDLRKVVQSSLSGIDKHITAMHKKRMKNLTSEELVPTLWDKCKFKCVLSRAESLELTGSSRSLLIMFEMKDKDEKRRGKLDRMIECVCVCEIQMVKRKKVNYGYVVENVLMGCKGAYVRNEGDK
nr:hypothetical protein [Tanacetum cinerariifolium]